MKGKSTCCNADGEWANHDKRVRSDLRFIVCSKCKQGDYEKVKDIILIK